MDTKKTKDSPRPSLGIKAGIMSEVERRRRVPGALLCDIVAFAVALFFARGHIFFGAYPLAASFIAALSDRVWIAMLGGISGALSLGRSGIIHAIILLVTVFLRLLISGGTNRGEGHSFSEPSVMRIAAVTVSAFIGAIYELLLVGVTLSSVMFGVSSVLSSALLSFVFQWLFRAGIGFRDVAYGERAIFRTAAGADKKRLILFQIAFLLFSALLCYCLDAYGFFGITLSYIYASFVTLFCAKRFGAVRAMALGFATTLPISPLAAVAFGLCGLSAGVLFHINLGYALIGGGAALALWCGYAGGISGLVSVFPEYSASAILFSPILKLSRAEAGGAASEVPMARADEMVSLAAGAYRARCGAFIELSNSLSKAARSIRRFAEGAGVSYEDYLGVVERVVLERGITPCEEIKNKIATKLYKMQDYSALDFKEMAEGGIDNVALALMLEGVCELTRSRLGDKGPLSLCNELEVMARAINDWHLCDSSEKVFNEEKSATALSVFCAEGFPDGALRVFGQRRLHIIAAGEDVDGKRISRPELKLRLEAALGARLTKFEFYRRGSAALLEADSARAFKCEYATASSPSSGNISGDCAVFFENNDYFFALLSDGMGSGELARRSSELVCEYLSSRLYDPGSVKNLLASLNNVLRSGPDERSATVDLFAFDLLLGEAAFVKSGAAPSYVRRGGSVFRIRSRSAPIGVMQGIDAERVGAEVKPGDQVIMMSDGVCASSGEAAWLIEYLNGAAAKSPSELCEDILSLAKERTACRDDMTVSVINVFAL